MTSIVDSLFERGFVAREIPDGDRRSVRLSITKAGRTALANAAAEFREVLDEVLAECVDPDAVLDALDALRDALDERWAQRASRDQVAAGAGGHR